MITRLPRLLSLPFGPAAPVVGIVLLLAGCATHDDPPAPRLLSPAEISALAPAPSSRPEPALESRAAGLRARAANLRRATPPADGAEGAGHTARDEDLRRRADSLRSQTD